MAEEHKHEPAGSGMKHWPAFLLGLIVVVVFVFAIFSYQLQSTEMAVVTTLGKITNIEKEPGLHFKWPYPIQSIDRFDNRLQCFEGNIGKLEETITADGKNLIIGMYVVYKVSDPEKLFRSLKTMASAEDKLGNLTRSIKDAAVGKHNFDEFINTDPAKMKIAAVEDEILKPLREKAAKDYGLHIESVGIRSLSLPEKISSQVFERMKAERGVVAENYRSEGKNAADKITDEADNKKKLVVAEAEAEAKRIRAEGDAKASSYYSIFKEEPELADFLRKIDSLRQVMPKKTTLILNTNYPPFDLLNPDSVFSENFKKKQEKQDRK